MERDETFPCSCGKGDVVRRTSASLKNMDRVYYACPDSKPKNKTYGCGFFKWEDELKKAKKAGTGSSSSSPGPSTPSGEANCSNCKLLSMKIKILEAKLDLALHPEDPSQSTAALHELIVALDELLVG